MVLNGWPWKWTEIILSFLRLHPSTEFWTLADYDGYSISSKGFLPTVVDIMVIWVKFTHSISILAHWFLKCQCSLLASPVWPLPIYLDSHTNHSRFLPILFFIASDSTSIPSHIHNWVLFCFGAIPSFFLELFLHWSPVAYWAPTNLGSSSFSVLSFCLFILFMGFSRQEYWSGLPFPSPVDHVLSELFTMTHPSWVALHNLAHSFIELDKAVIQVISLVPFCNCGFHYVFPLINKDKRLVETP